MKEYRVRWQQCPFVHHDVHIVFVKAETAEDAKVLVRDAVERKYGIDWFSVGDPEETKPLPQGSVSLS